MFQWLLRSESRAAKLRAVNTEENLLLERCLQFLQDNPMEFKVLWAGRMLASGIFDLRYITDDGKFSKALLLEIPGPELRSPTSGEVVIRRDWNTVTRENAGLPLPWYWRKEFEAEVASLTTRQTIQFLDAALANRAAATSKAS